MSYIFIYIHTESTTEAIHIITFNSQFSLVFSNRTEIFEFEIEFKLKLLSYLQRYLNY